MQFISFLILKISKKIKNKMNRKVNPCRWWKRA